MPRQMNWNQLTYHRALTAEKQELTRRLDGLSECPECAEILERLKENSLRQADRWQAWRARHPDLHSVSRKGLRTGPRRARWAAFTSQDMDGLVKDFEQGDFCDYGFFGLAVQTLIGWDAEDARAILCAEALLNLNGEDRAAVTRDFGVRFHPKGDFPVADKHIEYLIQSSDGETLHVWMRKGPKAAGMADCVTLQRRELLFLMEFLGKLNGAALSTDEEGLLDEDARSEREELLEELEETGVNRLDYLDLAVNWLYVQAGLRKTNELLCWDDLADLGQWLPDIQKIKTIDSTAQKTAGLLAKAVQETGVSRSDLIDASQIVRWLSSDEGRNPPLDYSAREACRQYETLLRRIRPLVTRTEFKRIIDHCKTKSGLFPHMHNCI